MSAAGSVTPKIARVWRRRGPRGQGRQLCPIIFTSRAFRRKKRRWRFSCCARTAPERASSSPSPKCVEAMSRFAGPEPRRIHNLPRDAEFLIELRKASKCCRSRHRKPVRSDLIIAEYTHRLLLLREAGGIVQAPGGPVRSCVGTCTLRPSRWCPCVSAPAPRIWPAPSPGHKNPTPVSGNSSGATIRSVGWRWSPPGSRSADFTSSPGIFTRAKSSSCASGPDR